MNKCNSHYPRFGETLSTRAGGKHCGARESAVHFRRRRSSRPRPQEAVEMDHRVGWFIGSLDTGRRQGGRSSHDRPGPGRYERAARRT